MKKTFFDEIDKQMERNPDIYLLMIGLGWPRTEELCTKYPQRAINTEASEQTALDIAVGLAYAGKIPVVYTITPFYWRAAETIRTYIAHERLNVKLIGAGRDDDYSKDDGFSHDAGDIKDLMGLLNIETHYPYTKEVIPLLLDAILESDKPCFVSLTR
jgi:transketolase